MPLIDNTNLIFNQGQLKQGNPVLPDGMDGNGTAYQIRETFFAKQDILLRLHDTMPIRPHLGLDRHNELAPSAIYPDIQLIDFYLPDFPYRCPQMILKRMRGDPKKQIDQPIVSNFCKQGLFIVKRV